MSCRREIHHSHYEISGYHGNSVNTLWENKLRSGSRTNCQSIVSVYRVCSVNNLSWVEFILRPKVSRPVRLGIGSPLGPMTRFYPYPYFSDNCFVVLPVGRPLWREDGSVTYSAIADWSGHWGPIVGKRFSSKVSFFAQFQSVRLV
jgi:hypothetical protein